VWIYDLNSDDVPVEGSPFLMNHWSNGAPGWSMGPPDQDAVMTVSYFKAYFNSSDPQRTDDFNGRCTDPNRTRAVCAVPNQTGAPNAPGSDATNSTSQNGTATLGQSTGAHTFFFSEQNNQTVNQTVYNASAGSSTGAGGDGASGSSSAPASALRNGYTLGWMALSIFFHCFL
jgi:hypothetical protein